MYKRQGLLLDIHGQHEHQSLLYKSKHLEILAAYVKAATQPVKQTIADRYRIYRSLEEKLGGFNLDAESRIREADFLRFEIEEIEASAMKEGEEEELTSLSVSYTHLDVYKRQEQCRPDEEELYHCAE